MDFRDVLYPNNLTIYSYNLKNGSLYYGKSTAAQEITEGEPLFAVIYNTQLYNRDVEINEDKTKFYPLNGTINVSVISEMVVVEPDAAIIDNAGVAIKIIHYDSENVIKRESVPAFLTFIPGLNYESSRFTLNTTLLCDIKEGDYITIGAYVAQAGEQNFTVLIVSSNLQINSI